MATDVPEPLLDVFKAAALSVTKLYKISAANEARARVDGYQECLEDLLDLLDKEGSSLGEAAHSRLRKWATDRHDGRERSQNLDSDDDVEKVEPTPTPESAQATETAEPSAVVPSAEEPEQEPYSFVVPTQDTFSLASQYPNIATLDLSDSRPSATGHSHSAQRTKTRTNTSGKRSASNLGRGAGSKRRHDYDDFWGGAFSNNGPKRGRHT